MVLCGKGRWPVALAAMAGWTGHDRGPLADVEERTMSAHRAIEIREKRRRVLSSCLVPLIIQNAV
jgi:hypothetical protein